MPKSTSRPWRFWSWQNILFIIAGVYVVVTFASSRPPGSSPESPADSASARYPKPVAYSFVDSTLLARCEALVQTCVNEGVLGRIEYSNISKVQTRPTFEVFDYEQKMGVAKALSYVAKSHGFEGHVKFRDSRTNATLGMYNALVGTLDWRRQ